MIGILASLHENYLALSGPSLRNFNTCCKRINACSTLIELGDGVALKDENKDRMKIKTGGKEEG